MRKLLYIFLAAVFVYSCEKDSTEEINDLNKVIQPLEVGYSWTFVDSTFTNEGTLSNVDTSTVSVIGKEISYFDGKEIDLFYWKWDFSERISLKANELGNVYSYGLRVNEESYIITKSLLQRYPVNIGDTWNRFRFNLTENNDTILGYVSDTIEYKCLYTNDAFKTIIGEIDCIVTFATDKTGDDSRETYIYHNPNIGYVGLESKINDILVFKKTLMNYDFTKSKASQITLKSAQSEGRLESIFNTYGLAIE